MHVQRFTSERKASLPAPNVGIAAVPLLFGREQVATLSAAQMTARFNGVPILIDGSAAVVMLYFEPHAQMDEHSNPRNTLFVALRGQGHMRIGGLAGETQAVQAGEAVLWPPNVDHLVWTDEEPLDALVIELPLP